MRRSGVRRPLLVLASLAIAFAWLMQVNGWSQNASWAFVRALGDGVPYIDQTVGEIGDLGTGDTANHGGHLYAAKAPGLPLATVPWYEAVSAAGIPTAGEPTRPVWIMNLWGSVLPALLLVVALWWFAEQLEPRLGTLTATIVGTSLGRSRATSRSAAVNRVASTVQTIESTCARLSRTTRFRRSFRRER